MRRVPRVLAARRPLARDLVQIYAYVTPDVPNENPRSLPVIAQAERDCPIFRGVGDTGADLKCESCSSLLLANVSPGAVYEITLRCASCGAMAPAPPWPRGRGLGGILHVVSADHQATGTFLLDMDQVLVGPRAVQCRARETGRDQLKATQLHMDIAGLEGLSAQARSFFEPILTAVGPPKSGASKHRLARLVQSVEENIRALKAGATTVDVHSVISLQRTVAAFARWEHDPMSSQLMQESIQPKAFDHNAVLLEVADLFEDARLAPEFVPVARARTPDLMLRVSATRRIELDVKTPRALREGPRGSLSRC